MISPHYLSSKSNKSSILQLLSLNSIFASLVVKMFKKTNNKKNLFSKRKVTKFQKKEKRATKTFGIVVGKILFKYNIYNKLNIFQEYF